MPDKKDLFKEKHPSKAFLSAQDEVVTDSTESAIPISKILDRKFSVFYTL